MKIFYKKKERKEPKLKKKKTIHRQQRLKGEIENKKS
jgi:hypothetical protein